LSAPKDWALLMVASREIATYKIPAHLRTIGCRFIVRYSVPNAEIMDTAELREATNSFQIIELDEL